MNETAPIREGEEIDTDKLASYLTARLDTGGSVTIQHIPAGSSNLTYLINVGDREFVLRRPPFGNTVKTAHDMRREFDVLTKLSEVYPAAPRALLFCDDESVIGSEFYLMERRHGIIVRGDAARSGASSAAVRDLNGSNRFRLEVCRSFVHNLADLHSVDLRAAGLADLGKPAGYNRRQVEGWTKRYAAAKTGEWPQLEAVITWLNANIPSESTTSLIHNDYKFDNVMLDPEDLTRVVAVLDWEMATVGDPLMDLGTTLGYWMPKENGDELLNMPFNPRILMENVSRRELVEMYSEAAGREVPNMLFYYVFGTFKIAVIAQQIFARYMSGKTKDARFASFDRFVGALGMIAARALEKDSI